MSADGTLSQCKTGAVRSTDAAKTRYDLISPIGLRRIAETYAEGAEKYGDFNWELGFPIGDILNHAIRHLYLYLGGDRSEDHLSHCGWGIMAAMHSEEKWPHLNGNMRDPNCELSEEQRRIILERNSQRVIDAARSALPVAEPAVIPGAPVFVGVAEAPAFDSGGRYVGKSRAAATYDDPPAIEVTRMGSGLSLVN